MWISEKQYDQTLQDRDKQIYKLTEELKSLKKANVPLLTYLVSYSIKKNIIKERVVANNFAWQDEGMVFLQGDKIMAYFDNVISYRVI